MRIDLHCHTIKSKSGDPSTRNIDVLKFVKIMVNNQVSIVAITNHNIFDRKQYNLFSNEAKKSDIQVWPGIELDIKGDTSNGHVIVISNPDSIERFSSFCRDIINNISPDKLCVTIDSLCSKLQNVDALLTVHYGGKSHSLSNKDIDTLKAKLNDKTPFYLEVSNLRSAGIYYGKNEYCIIGSDVRDWNNYNGNLLPELKMPIKDFNHFVLLMKKDKQIIKTFLNQKKSEEVTVSPFSDCTVKLSIYNDINVIFGGKGTGKSKMLESIKRHFEKNGNSDVAYYSGATNESEYSKITKIENELSDFNYFGVDDCKSDFQFIKNWKEQSLTKISDYYEWAETKQYSKLSQSFGFKTATFSERISDEKYNEILEDRNVIERIKSEYNMIKHIDDYTTMEDKAQLKSLINKLTKNVNDELFDEWLKNKSLYLESWTINKMKSLCEQKSGSMSLPAKTGLLDTYNNCEQMLKTVSKITKQISIKEKTVFTDIGTVQNKGKIRLKKEIHIDLKGKNLIYQGNMRVTSLRKVPKLLINIKDNIYTDKKGDYISTLNKTLNDENIVSLRDFVGVKSTTVNENGAEYNPSQGEKSMLLLDNSLVDENKQFYILDEPELSLGPQFINDVILPRLIALSKMNKCIILCTHDANIAVRTLPLLSIYREYEGNNTYKTYIGNPFTDELVNVENKKDVYSWTDKSMTALEGGEMAFIERKEIYGE